MALVLSSGAAESAPPGTPAASTAAVEGMKAPLNSPPAKIHLGMSKKQVKERIGAPSGESAHLTWKAFIPFYFGNDAHRTSYSYKDMGRVVFADGNVFGGGGTEVIRVEDDPGESGVAR
jgi:hypothetical protein